MRVKHACVSFKKRKNVRATAVILYVFANYDTGFYLANFAPNVKLLILNYEYTITIEVSREEFKYVLLEELQVSKCKWSVISRPVFFLINMIYDTHDKEMKNINPSSANSTKCSNTLKLFKHKLFECV